MYLVDKHMIPLKSVLMIWASVEKEHDQVYKKIQTGLKFRPQLFIWEMVVIRKKKKYLQEYLVVQILS